MERKEVAIVTGGSRGIGAAICEKLAEEGVAVVLNFASDATAAEQTAERIRSRGGTVVTHQADVSDPDAARGLFEHAMTSFGDVSILVNNAGVSRDGLLCNMEIDAWRRVMEVNFGGAYHMTHAVIRQLMAQGRGSIVNVSSAMGERGWIGESNYAASKGAMNAFTRSIAMETTRFGVRVNAVLPGFIETDLVADLADGPKGRSIRKQIPMRRFGTVTDVAETVWFLASPRSPYVTGALYTVDGGASTALGLGRP